MGVNSTTPGGDDGSRIEAYLAGRAEVFQEVEGWMRGEFRRRYPALRHEHDDLCQLVHTKLLTNLRDGRFEGRAGLHAYVTGIVHYTAIDRMRQVYRQRALTKALGDQAAPGGGGPYGTLETRDRGRLLHRVLMALPASCRRLWRMIFVDKLSYTQIGQQLAVPEGTVKSRMWHCRRKAIQAWSRISGPPRQQTEKA